MTATSSTFEKKISIIVPCYNVERYLPKCLDSLLAQTLDDIEVICINDGSPDGCLDILRRYEAENADVIVVIDKPNEGVWRGRRDGIAIARGEYIGFVDSDDYVAPDFCEKLYACAKENEADIAVCGFHRIDAETDEVLTTELAEPRMPFDVAEHPERLLELNTAPWNKVFAASLLKNMPDLRNVPRIFDDMMMHLLVYLQVHRVAFVPAALVFYVIREGSIMTTIDQEKIDSTYAAMAEIKQLYADRGASESLMGFLDAAAFLHLGISLPFRITYDQNADLRVLLKENRIFLDETFPTWRDSCAISLSFARQHGGAHVRTWMGRCVYKAHLMRPALGCYRFMIDRLGKDIKW